MHFFLHWAFIIAFFMLGGILDINSAEDIWVGNRII